MSEGRQAPTVKADPYSNSRIRSGARSFVLGKAVSSVAGVATLLLVVRALDIAEFAAYSVMFGIVEVLLVVSSVGTMHVLNRFIPEIFALHYGGALRSLLRVALGIRFSVLLAVLAASAIFIGPIAAAIGLDAWRGALMLYLVVALLRTVNNTLYQVLEAMLSQKYGQSAFALVTVSRFALVGAYYLLDLLSLHALVVIEIGSELVGALVMARFVALQAGRAQVPATGTDAERGWLAANRRRLVDFGLKGYSQGLLILPYTGMVNRMVMGAYFPPAQIAQFGFGQTVYDLLARYLPAQFFAGLVRPVMTARFSSGGGFGQVERITNLTLNVNLVLIGLAFACLFAGGEDMLLAVTRGKYGQASLDLLALMLCLLALESWRHVLDQMSHTLERYGFLVFSNALLGGSLLLGIALFDTLGVFALPVANAAIATLSNLMVIAWVRHTGFPFRQDLAAPLYVALASGAVAAGSVLLLPADLHWLLRVGIAIVAYAGLTWIAVGRRPGDRALLMGLLARRRAAGVAPTGTDA
ncbi:MAG: lipopolysaccharide biosynthesis protein [Lautropia sp.]